MSNTSEYFKCTDYLEIQLSVTWSSTLSSVSEATTTEAMKLIHADVADIKDNLFQFLKIFTSSLVVDTLYIINALIASHHL